MNLVEWMEIKSLIYLIVHDVFSARRSLKLHIPPRQSQKDILKTTQQFRLLLK